MKGLLISLLAVAVLVISIGAQAAPVTLKISTLYPNGTSTVVALKKAGEKITAATDGRVKLKIYAGGVMGDDKAVQRKIRIGQLQGTLAQAGAFAASYADSQIYNLPLVFHSYDEVDAVRQQLDPVLVEGFENNGWVTFGFIDGGFAYLMSQHRVASVAEFQQQKMWLPSADPGSLAAAKAFGLSSVVLPISSVLTSLQTGAINAFIAPPVAALTLQWFTRADYVTNIPLLYTYGLLAISERQFKRLDEPDQQLVRGILTKAVAKMDAASRKENEQAFAALVAQGIEVVTPSDTQLPLWRSNAAKADQALMDVGHVSPEIREQMRQILEQYRASH